MKELPEAYINRMKKLLGSEFSAYIKAMEDPPVRAYRINTDKTTPYDEKITKIFGSKKVPYTDSGFYLEDPKAGSHPYHHAGLIYIQEPAAMAPAECVDIDPSWNILDMCAAPGGKSTQLKNKIPDGILVSNEIIPSRCKILTGNIERLGLKDTITTCMDTKRLADTFPETFDLIMCDAPCSGEGMFRKEDIAIDEWSELNVTKCAARQCEILDNAAKCLKNGGYIIYSTCTFSLEEDEMTIDRFLESHSDFEIVKVQDKINSVTAAGIHFDGCKTKNIDYARRFYPHICPGEGQFMAVLHNKNTYIKVSKKENIKSVKPDKTIFDFLDNVLISYDRENVIMYNGRPVYMRPDFPVNKGTVFSYGVTIGEVKKNIIKPHHQFFMAMGNNFKNKINLSSDSEELKKYLHGEEFSFDATDGWAAVCVDGTPTGGVKISRGTCKNHYPKGLRTK